MLYRRRQNPPVTASFNHLSAAPAAHGACATPPLSRHAARTIWSGEGGSEPRSGCSPCRVAGGGSSPLGFRGAGTVVSSLRCDSGTRDREGRKEECSGPSHPPPLLVMVLPSPVERAAVGRVTAAPGGGSGGSCGERRGGPARYRGTNRLPLPLSRFSLPLVAAPRRRLVCSWEAAGSSSPLAAIRDGTGRWVSQCQAPAGTGRDGTGLGGGAGAAAAVSADGAGSLVSGTGAAGARKGRQARV